MEIQKLKVAFQSLIKPLKTHLFFMPSDGWAATLNSACAGVWMCRWSLPLSPPNPPLQLDIRLRLLSARNRVLHSGRWRYRSYLCYHDLESSTLQDDGVGSLGLWCMRPRLCESETVQRGGGALKHHQSFPVSRWLLFSPDTPCSI